MSRRPRVGIDLAPVGFRARAPGTAVHVENQVRALLALPVEWDWLLVATPRALREAPFFTSFSPIICPDGPLSLHSTFRLGRVWAQANCDLGLATAFFCPLTGPPVLTNYFDANFFHAVRDYHSFRGRVRLAILRALWRRSRRRSKALFIDSEYGKSQMIEADPATATKWVVAPCGCPSVGPGSQKTPAWAEPLRGRPFILYVGAFSENKNQRRLIAAWDQLRRRHEKMPSLVLIGPCPEDYRRTVIEPTRRRSARPDEVVLPGFIPGDEVAWAFRNAYAYVQPSFAEGFGLPVIEAMSCGLPVACSNSTSLPEVAGGAAILFNPADVTDMAGVLEKLVFDHGLRATLAVAGPKRAAVFTWKRHAEKVACKIQSELAKLAR